jgi:hypothetical protein
MSINNQLIELDTAKGTMMPLLPTTLNNLLGSVFRIEPVGSMHSQLMLFIIFAISYIFRKLMLPRFKFCFFIISALHSQLMLPRFSFRLGCILIYFAKWWREVLK